MCIKHLAGLRCMPNFGNAGAVKSLVANGIQRYNDRTAGGGSGSRVLTAADLGVDAAARQERMDSLLRNFVGSPGILEKLQDLEYRAREARLFDRDPRDLISHYKFVGKPGTGKTTIARAMASILHSLGVLPSDKCVETSASRLQTEYVGQAGRQTREMLRSALGGVLFVDEAYALIPRPGTFNQEIVDQIVQCLTDTEFVGKIVVIFAGYEADVEELMRSNDGLYRRFKETWIFEDWSPDTATTAALSVLRTSTRWSHLQFRDAERSLLAAFEAPCRAPKWANGGDIETLLSKCDEKRSARGRRTATISNVVSVEDVAAAAANKLTSAREEQAHTRFIRNHALG
eukprot:ANDGO_08427.mRNA.1 ESX-1 secretion system protein EccA1